MKNQSKYLDNKQQGVSHAAFLRSGLLAMLVLFLVCFLVSCSQKMPVSTAGLDAVQVVEAAPVSTDGVRDSIDGIGDSVDRADDAARDAEETIRNLERNLQAAVSTTDKMTRFTELLRATQSADKAMLVEFADRLKLLTDEGEKNRKQHLDDVAKLKDENITVRLELFDTKVEVKKGKKREADLREDVKDLKIEKDQHKGKAAGYRVTAVANEEAAKENLEFKEKYLNLLKYKWLVWTVIAWLAIKLFVSISGYSPAGWWGKLLRILF